MSDILELAKALQELLDFLDARYVLRGEVVPPPVDPPPVDPPPVDPPPDPSEPVLPLMGYEWEEASSPQYKGNSSVLLPKNMDTDKLGGAVKVNGQNFWFVMSWPSSGRELWHGPKYNTFTDPVLITVLDVSGRKWQAVDKVNGGGDSPPPSSGYFTNFHHTQCAGPDGGISIVQCPGDERFDRVVYDGQEVRFHGQDEGRDSWWDPRRHITKDNADVLAYRGDEVFRFPTNRKASKGIVRGGCYGDR